VGEPPRPSWLPPRVVLHVTANGTRSLSLTSTTEMPNLGNEMAPRGGFVLSFPSVSLIWCGRAPRRPTQHRLHRQAAAAASAPPLPLRPWSAHAAARRRRRCRGRHRCRRTTIASNHLHRLCASPSRGRRPLRGSSSSVCDLRPAARARSPPWPHGACTVRTRPGRALSPLPPSSPLALPA